MLGLLVMLVICFQNYRSYQGDQRLTDSQSWVLLDEVEIEKCAQLELHAQVQCIVHSAPVSREKQLEEYDLAAQQDMAWWALFALGLGLFSLFLSFGSFVVLVWTLRETRRLNEVEARAYVIGEKFTVVKIWNEEDPEYYQLQVEFEVRNSGSTPAFDMTIVSSLGWNPIDRMLDWSPNSPPSSRSTIGPGQHVGQSVKIQANYQDWTVEDNIKNGATIWARGVVRYRDIYDQWWEYTFMWKLKSPERILNAQTPKSEDEKFIEFGLTVHESLNNLKKIIAPD